MNKKSIIITVILSGLGLLALNVFAQAPNTIMYQGRLTNPDGAPLQQADVDSVHFTIYTDAMVALYDTAVTDLVVDMNGVFTIELGPLATSVFSGAKRLLGIKVNTDPEMEPPQPLTAAPYSFATDAVPGIASSYKSVVSLTGTSTAIDSVTITVPTSGFMLIQACGYFHMIHSSGAGDQVTRASVDDVRHNMNFSNFAYSRIESGDVSGNYAHSWAVMMTESVSAGTHKYFVNADCYVASGWHPANSECSDTHIVATFYPTNYGSVVNTKANINVDPDSPDGVIRDTQK